jgi:hypothetical protein
VKAGVGYFEVKIINPGSGGSVSVGLTSRNWTSNRHPGSDSNSYGYLGNEGRKSHNTRCEPYGSKFCKEDIVGCGYNFDRRVIFWTLNGKYLGDAYSKVTHGTFYPTVGLHSPGAAVQFNFGEKPFYYNLKAYEKVKLLSYNFNDVLISPFFLRQRMK